MIFLTVGTSFPFDRLTRAVDELVGQKKIDPKIFAQVGVGGYQPKYFESVATLDKNNFDRCFQEADALIAHAGMGTITMALAQNKPILVMPRLKKYQELVNDHQLATAKRFEQLGHVLAVYNTTDLEEKIPSLETFQPLARQAQPQQVSERIGAFLQFFMQKK